MTNDNSTPPNYPTDQGPLTEEQLRAIVEAVCEEHGDADFVEQLLADSTTASLVLAWRRSVRELDAAEKIARDGKDPAGMVGRA